MRRSVLKSMFAAGAWAVSAKVALARKRYRKLAQAISALVRMEHSAFPYDGQNPETGEEFLNVSDGQRRGHKSPRGGVHWEDVSYNDQRTLLYLPAGFDLNKTAALVVFFHGNEATLERDVIGRQHVPQQLAESGMNGVLAAPQFAVDVRDSSPGNFWRAGYFANWLTEVEADLAKLHGQGARASDFAGLPVMLVAYSGGYFPAAWCLKDGGANGRIAGLVLMDAIYGDVEKFAAWVAGYHKSAFLFSAYSTASRKWNLQLQDALKQGGIGFSEELPESIQRTSINFVEVPGDVNHVEFMSTAWTTDPLQWVLRRIAQFRK